MLITLYSAEEVANLAKKLTAKAVIFIDVDDTLITPTSTSFRIKPGEDSIIDLIKKNPDQYPNYVDIVSSWRASRQTMLVDQDWPSIINEMKQTHPVYALTKMDTGKFGVIDSMQEWRYLELQSFNLEFTHNLQDTKCIEGMPCLTHGILMTGKSLKSEAIAKLISLESVEQIMFIDDNKTYLEDVANFCQLHKIDFIGVHYCGVENIIGSINPKLKNIQIKYLLEENQWLEDDQALKLITDEHEVSID